MRLEVNQRDEILGCDISPCRKDRMKEYIKEVAVNRDGDYPLRTKTTLDESIYKNTAALRDTSTLKQHQHDVNPPAE